MKQFVKELSAVLYRSEAFDKTPVGFSWRESGYSHHPAVFSLSHWMCSFPSPPFPYFFSCTSLLLLDLGP